MCDCFEGDEDSRPAETAIPLAALMERTRTVEARKGGDRVPEALWPVFFGLRSGSIPWAHHQRMLASRETALAFLKIGLAPERRHRKNLRLNCTEEGTIQKSF